MGDPRHTLGRRAEAAVAAWLQAHGWRILAERYRIPAGEIDLVALDPDRRLVAVEVRLRRSARTGGALESVQPAHLRRVRAALLTYARTASVPHQGLRVDLVTVTADPRPGAWRLTRLPAVDAW
jgi:putative endonuclease